MRLLFPPILLFVTFTATAGNFRAVEESGAVLYDAPSREATPVYVLSRDYPLEVLVELDAWAKVRDAAGAISWIEKRQLGERRTVVVTATSADAHLRPEDDAPVRRGRLGHGDRLRALEPARGCAVGPRPRPGRADFRVAQE